MPWTRKQVKFLLSKGTPLTGTQRDKMLNELHSDPSLGHAQKKKETRNQPYGLDRMRT